MKHERYESEQVHGGGQIATKKSKSASASEFGGYYAKKVALWREKQKASKMRGEYVEESGDDSDNYEDDDDDDEDEDEDEDEDREREGDGGSGSTSSAASTASSSKEEPLLELALNTTQNEQRRILVEALEGAQLTRYETYRRANLNAQGVRKVCAAACALPGAALPGDQAKVLAGVAKVFVGNLVTRAAALRDADGDGKPQDDEDVAQLGPDHIRRAWTSLLAEQNGSVVSGGSGAGARQGMRPWRSTNRRGGSGSLF